MALLAKWRKYTFVLILGRAKDIGWPRGRMDLLIDGSMDGWMDVGFVE